MKNKLINLLIIILLLLSVFFGFKAYYEYQNLKASKDLYDDIYKQVLDSLNDEDYVEVEGMPLMEYAEIKLAHPDFFGWIEIEGTKINYPIMHTPNDPEYYLRRDINGDYSIPGTIFLDGRNNADSDNLIIYGHYMENGTMFGDLMKYRDEAFFKDHPIIKLNDVYHKHEYQIMSVFYDYVRDVDDYDFKYYNFIDANDADDFKRKVEILKAKSLYDTNVDASYGDKLVTLSTCSYHRDYGRFVVVAVEVK